MDILFLLIPMSLVLVLVIVGVFAWAIHSGQFDEIEREGERPLMDEAEPSPESGSSGRER